MMEMATLTVMIYSLQIAPNGKMQIMTGLAITQLVIIQMLVLELKDSRTKTDLAVQIPTEMDTLTLMVDGLSLMAQMNGQMMLHSGLTLMAMVMVTIH